MQNIKLIKPARFKFLRENYKNSIFLSSVVNLAYLSIAQ